MKLNGLTTILLILSFVMTGLCQESELEVRVRDLFFKEEGLRTDELRNRLRQMGDDKEIAAVLIRLASKSKHAGEGSLELGVLMGAVASLGEIRASSASELLSAMLTDRKVHENVRARAARSLGQIDPEANKETLLRSLDPSEHYLVRVYAAEGLGKTRDAEALKALERFGPEDKDSYVRDEFAKAATTLREKGVRPN